VSDTRSLQVAGYIVGEATPTEFIFVSPRDNYPPRWEYLVVESREQVGGELRDVMVLAQVELIASESQVLTKQLDVEAVRRICEARLNTINVWGKARILGYLAEGEGGQVEVLLPRRAVVPGNPVYIAPREVLERFFSYPSEEGLHIGCLISRPDVPVYVSVRGFRRHLAILAQTGAGKSYTAGVLIEELLEKGATIIVIDPHADYVFLSQTQDGRKYRLAERITVFRNPGSTGRYSGKDIRNLRSFEISFADLEPEDIFGILSIPERWAYVRNAIKTAVERLRGRGEAYSPTDLLAELDEMAAEGVIDEDKCRSAKVHLQPLLRLPVFGASSVSISQILRPQHVSVIDLSGLTDTSMDYIVSWLLNQVYQEVRTGRWSYPVFVFIEEAHKFIPSQSEKGQKKTYSSGIINTLAAEGRKFGIFLVLISQRPFKIHSDSLSQCNSQIIMKITNPRDQTAVMNASERLSHELMQDLPGLNVGEAIVVGEITRVPVMIRVRRRQTREGGADIDILAKLREARIDRRSREEMREMDAKTIDSGEFVEV